MKLEAITVRPNGEFEFWHDDGDLFWGHSILISGDLNHGLEDADIPGQWFIEYLCDIAYPFWEFGDQKKREKKYPNYIVEEMKKFEDEYGKVNHDLYSPSLIYKKIQDYNVYRNEDKLTSYKIIYKYLRMLDLKKLVSTIRADSLDTYEDRINFGLSSDVCGCMLFCATYGTIYPNNKLEVTHNCQALKRVKMERRKQVK